MPTCETGTSLPWRPWEVMTSDAAPVFRPAASPPCPENVAPTTTRTMNVNRLSAMSFLPRDTSAPLPPRLGHLPRKTDPPPAGGTYDSNVAATSPTDDGCVTRALDLSNCSNLG